MFLLAALLAYLAGQILPFLTAFSIALFHEAGHALAAVLLKYPVRGLRLQSFGVAVLLDTDHFRKPWHEMVIAGAGPFVNFCLLLFGTVWHDANELFMYGNTFLLLINLLPILPLDGGRILYVCLCGEMREKHAKTVMRGLSIASSFLLFFGGIYLFLQTGFNYSLFAASVFLLGGALDEKPHNKVAQSFHPTEDFCEIRHYAVHADVPASEAMHLFHKRKTVLFDVLDRQGAVLGTVSGKQIVDGIVKYGYDTKLKDLL